MTPSAAGAEVVFTLPTLRRSVPSRSVMAVTTEESPPRPTMSRLPRATRALIQAHLLTRMLRDSTVANLAALARVLGLTRARVTQLTALTFLAPDIQEEILFLTPVARGVDPISEHRLRDVVRHADWQEQRRQWRALQARRAALVSQDLGARG